MYISYPLTSIHSSRMHNDACCPHLPACTAPRGVSAPGGLSAPGGGGVFAPRGRGVSARGVSATLPVNRMTKRCKNMTFANFVFGR